MPSLQAQFAKIARKAPPFKPGGFYESGMGWLMVLTINTTLVSDWLGENISIEPLREGGAYGRIRGFKIREFAHLVKINRGLLWDMPAVSARFLLDLAEKRDLGAANSEDADFEKKLRAHYEEVRMVISPSLTARQEDIQKILLEN